MFMIIPCLEDDRWQFWVTCLVLAERANYVITLSWTTEADICY